MISDYLITFSMSRSVPAVGHFFSHTMRTHRIINKTTLIINAVFLDILCPPYFIQYCIIISIYRHVRLTYFYGNMYFPVIMDVYDSLSKDVPRMHPFLLRSLLPVFWKVPPCRATNWELCDAYHDNHCLLCVPCHL